MPPGPMRVISAARALGVAARARATAIDISSVFMADLDDGSVRLASSMQPPGATDLTFSGSGVRAVMMDLGEVVSKTSRFGQVDGISRLTLSIYDLAVISRLRKSTRTRGKVRREGRTTQGSDDWTPLCPRFRPVRGCAS